MSVPCVPGSRRRERQPHRREKKWGGHVCLPFSTKPRAGPTHRSAPVIRFIFLSRSQALGTNVIALPHSSLDLCLLVCEILPIISRPSKEADPGKERIKFSFVQGMKMNMKKENNLKIVV